MKTSKQYDVEEMRALGGLRYWESRPEFMADTFEGKTLRTLINLIRRDEAIYQKFLILYNVNCTCMLSKGSLPKRPGC
jgi:hypothetical protein